jgi:uncharacterized membrane protein YbhN (UPF0104 family)
VRLLRTLLLVLGATALIALVVRLGADSVVSTLARVTWWQFGLICLAHGVSVVADTYAWRLTIRGAPPSLWRLLAAKCAGEAFNVLTAIGSVGGEAVKAWLLRRDMPYEASVPSLILAKTSLVIAQALMLAVGIAIAWRTGAGGTALLAAMGWVLLGEVVGIGGFLGVQLSGVIGRAGRLGAWLGARGRDHAERLDRSLREYYRESWPAFAGSTAMHFLGWLLGAVEAWLVLRSLDVPGSPATATLIEAVGSAVRFATFLVPASLGTLEGANAAAFTALGWSAAAGLAFTLVRRARQAVWIVLGVVIVVSMGAGWRVPAEPAGPAPSGAR